MPIFVKIQKISFLASMSTNRMFKISWLLRSLTVISLYCCGLTLSKLSKYVEQKTLYDLNWQVGKIQDGHMNEYIYE